MPSYDLNSLRQKYSRFTYESFNWKLIGTSLLISFKFKISPDITFSPTLVINNIPKSTLSQIDKALIDNYVFNLGLAEIPTYWKSTCSQTIKVNAGNLTKEQKRWWRELFLNGMGEFFYENKIDFTAADFIEIRSSGPSLLKIDKLNHDARHLILNGGGRDSVVSIETIKQMDKLAGLLMLNPTTASGEVADQSGIINRIIVERKIDEKLLNLNKEGYLNGHTPFSSYLSFLSVFVCLLCDYKYAIVSNEKSSNEENVEYLNTKINHQFSKSFQYERMFRDYVAKYLSESLEYISLVRPLYELQISKIFALHKNYFKTFKSCNRGSKTNSWCAQCPKCLSIYISLYPFIDNIALLEIFGSDLYQNAKLKDLLLHISGKKTPKPFECVGTYEEVKAGLFLSIQKLQENNVQLPPLLIFAKEEIVGDYKYQDAIVVLNQWDGSNFLTKDMEKELKLQLTNA